MNPPIAIVGTGRMAKALGALLAPVSAIAGRCLSSAAADQLHSRHILIAVSDDAIPDVAAKLAAGGLNGAIVLHTSGAAGPGALSALHPNNSIGVLHPLQTVPTAERGVATLPGATYAFAGDPEAVDWARSLVARLKGKPLAIDPAHWHHYHAAAVMACNYQVTLMDAALELMEIAGVGREAALQALAPIVRATVDNIFALGPAQALTGPIRRGDTGTVRSHVAALENALPETRQLYIAAGLRTIILAERALGIQK